MKVLVTGAAGQLGRAFTEHRGAAQIVGWTRSDVDITNHRDVRDAIETLRPDVIVNCASFNQVDQAEDDQVTALEVNGIAVGILARAAAAIDAVLVHYSTDFVFAGTAAQPYTEDDRPEPRSVYAQSKLIGEWLAADAPKHYVFRVESLFGGPHRRSSIDRIADKLTAGEPAPVFFDRVVSPSFVADVVEASWFAISERPAFGLYHCVNGGQATWLEVGQEIARCLGLKDPTLQPVSVQDVNLRAPRPQYAALSNAKLADAGFVMPSWQEAIRRYLQGAGA